MPFATATILGLVGAAAGVAGTIATVSGQSAAANASKKAEAVRATQMNLDAARNRRDITRKAIMARSQALSTATNQGAEAGSGLQGGEAQVFGQAGNAMQQTTQNQDLGGQLFRYNSQITAGQSLAQTGQGIAGVGGQIFQNRDMLGRVGSYFTGQTSWG